MTRDRQSPKPLPGDRVVSMRDVFLAKQKELLVMLLGGRGVVDHPGEKGTATEESWRRLLRSYLPSRYQVGSGFVVDVKGRVSDQMDVLLLDNQYSPVFFESGGVRYFPAESVYAAFEVKQDMTRENIAYAGAKVASVRRLYRTSARIPHAGGAYEPKTPGRIIGGLLATGAKWKPPLGKPFERSLLGLDEESALDLGCVIEHGAFSVDHEAESPIVTKSQPDLSLTFFILSLLDTLQALGTVAAIDYGEWLRHAHQT